MAVQFTVRLVDLRRSIRRLLMRLDDESFTDFVVFDASDSRLQIRTGNSSEQLPAEVQQSGVADVPVTVFSALAKAMRFHWGRNVEFRFSPGRIVVNRNVIQHRGITLC